MMPAFYDLGCGSDLLITHALIPIFMPNAEPHCSITAAPSKIASQSSSEEVKTNQTASQNKTSQTTITTFGSGIHQMAQKQRMEAPIKVKPRFRISVKNVKNMDALKSFRMR